MTESEDFALLFTSEDKRPEHPDFDNLLGIVNDLDEMADQGIGGRDPVEVGVNRIGDPDSIYYVAFQRVFRILGVETMADLKERQDAIAMMAACYLEGMVVGYELRQTHRSRED